MTPIRTITGVSLSVLFGFAVSGCVNMSASDQVDMADSDSALNYHKPNWQKPFWEQDRSTAPVVQTAPVNPDNGQVLTNIGLVTDRSGQTVAAAWPADLQTTAAGYGFHLVPQTQLDEALNRSTACTDEALTTACADSLAVFPGIRLLIDLGAEQTVTIVDSSADVAYPAMSLPASNTNEALMQQAKERASLSPWTLKVFAGNDNRLYITAGKMNGLKVGTELTVHKPGQLVSAPNGQPIAWRAGDRIGKVKVAELVGNQLSVIALVSGEKPTPADELLLEAR
ncbi:MAG: hypothetical protein R3303_09005 [Marinobacter sp.]|nr:hypothetical protein [Marinobacter sp.]